MPQIGSALIQFALCHIGIFEDTARTPLREAQLTVIQPRFQRLHKRLLRKRPPHKIRREPAPTHILAEGRRSIAPQGEARIIPLPVIVVQAAEQAHHRLFLIIRIIILQVEPGLRIVHLRVPRGVMNGVRGSPERLARVIVHLVLLNGKTEQQIGMVAAAQRPAVGQQVLVEHHQMAGDRAAAIGFTVFVHLLRQENVLVVLEIIDRHARFQCQAVGDLVRQIEGSAQLVAVVLLPGALIAAGQLAEIRRSGTGQHRRGEKEVRQRGISRRRRIEGIHPFARAVVVGIGQVEAEIAVKVVRRLEGQVRKGRKAAVARTPQRSRLIVEAQADGIGDSLGPAPDLDIRIRGMGGAQVICHQVGGIVIERVQAVLIHGHVRAVALVPEIIVRLAQGVTFRIAVGIRFPVVVHSRIIFHRLQTGAPLGIPADPLRQQGLQDKGVADIGREQGVLVVAALFRRDDHHPVGCPRAVDGCRCGILQYGERFDVVRVERGERVAAHLEAGVVRGDHPIDHEQRVTVAGNCQVVRTADNDAHIVAARITRLARDIHPRHLALGQRQHVGCGLVLQPGGIHRRHRARHLSAPLLPVGDHRHLLQRFTALFQPHTERFSGTVTHRHRLIAHTRKGQPAALFGQAE